MTLEVGNEIRDSNVIRSIQSGENVILERGVNILLKKDMLINLIKDIKSHVCIRWGKKIGRDKLFPLAVVPPHLPGLPQPPRIAPPTLLAPSCTTRAATLPPSCGHCCPLT